ncbi:hypothetical protein Tco_0902069 [Tanacetum coccineum]
MGFVGMGPVTQTELAGTYTKKLDVELVGTYEGYVGPTELAGTYEELGGLTKQVEKGWEWVGPGGPVDYYSDSLSRVEPVKGHEWYLSSAGLMRMS